MKLSRRLLPFAVLAAGSHAQQVLAQPNRPALSRIVVVVPNLRGADNDLNLPFFEGMQRLGWVEGQNIAYDRVFADDRMDLLPQLAVDIVARKPELIVALGPPVAGAMKRATASIPIVFAVVVDPLSSGLVESLAHPGGNSPASRKALPNRLRPSAWSCCSKRCPASSASVYWAIRWTQAL